MLDKSCGNDNSARSWVKSNGVFVLFAANLYLFLGFFSALFDHRKLCFYFLCYPLFGFQETGGKLNKTLGILSNHIQHLYARYILLLGLIIQLCFIWLLRKWRKSK